MNSVMRMLRYSWNKCLNSDTRKPKSLSLFTKCRWCTIALLALAAMVVISGIGGFGTQTWDWHKHNAMLSRAHFLLALMILVLFSGMDFVGAILTDPENVSLQKIISDYHLEWWAEDWQFSSNISLINFVQQHMLGGWLLIALVIHAIRRNDERFPVMLVLSLSPLWSPFISIGLLPFLGFAMLRIVKKRQLHAMLSMENAVGIVVLMIMLFYFQSRLTPLSLPEQYNPPLRYQHLGDFLFYPLQNGAQPFAGTYALFVGCEFLLL